MFSIFTDFLSWLPSWATLLSAGGLLVVAAGGLVWSRLPLAPHGTLALIIGAGCLASGMWLAGAGNMRAAQERDALRARAETLSREVESEGRKVADMEADARRAAEHARAAEKRARAAEAVAAALPDSTVGAATSDAIRNLWRP